MIFWRLSGVAHARAFDGGYGLLYDGRWNTAGHAVTFCATSPSLCVLEKLVHVEDLPALMMVRYEAPDSLDVEALSLADLPEILAASGGVDAGARRYLERGAGVSRWNETCMGNLFTELLAIDLPIVQAPMGGATSPALAAAVSNAGGLGMLALGWSTPDAVRDEIRATKALTRRPFGVNLVLTQSQEERLALALAERVDVISFFWGRAGQEQIETAHRGGARVLHTVSSAADARRVADDGVDVVVAQGWEAGGHVHGSVATLALVPAVVDRVGKLPVLAAGGIADGRGLVAALALGAAGAWIGTRFLAAHEAAIHPRYRDLLLAACETETEYGTLFDVTWPDAPHRTLRNSTIRAWEAAGRPHSGGRPGEGETVGQWAAGHVVRYQSHTPTRDTEGDIEAMALWAGQVVALVHKTQPAADIVREIADEAKSILRQLAIAPL